MKKLATRAIGLYLNTLAVLSPDRAGEKVFRLFCRPFRPVLTEKQKQFLDSAERFEMAVGDATVAAYRWGTGPRKVLFLHGWQSHTYRWKAYIEALPREEYTVYSIDAPGHGLSGGDFLSVPLYSEVIRDFIVSIDRLDAVVSHSLGSFSMLYTLYQYPLLPVDRIVAMAPPGEAVDFVRVFKETLGLSGRVIDQFRDHFRARYDLTPEFFSSARFASSVGVRGLIIHDELDTEAPYEHAVSIHKKWKRSRLVTTKGLGHNLRSPSVVDEVVGFISEGAMTSAGRSRGALPSYH